MVKHSLKISICYKILNVFLSILVINYFQKRLYQRFQESYYNVKYFKKIKCLKILQKAEMYLWEPKRCIDVWLSYTEASENIEIFKVKQRWSKSSWLLQRAAFLVWIWNTIYVLHFCKFSLNCSLLVFLNMRKITY